jgi:peptide/nickel transport system substrate-binding protein
LPATTTLFVVFREEDPSMTKDTSLDWSELSGPTVTRRTMLKFAAATGAAAFATRLAAADSFAVGGTSTNARPVRAQEAKKGGTLKLGFGISQIPTLDPAQVNLGIVAGELVSNLFSSLVQFDEKLGLTADLAETWDVAKDGLSYTFHLRKGLSFHNGDPLTAKDLVYTFQRTTNKDFASPHANKLALVTDATAPDDLTFALKLSAPFAPFLAVACSRGPGRALTPISKRAIDEMGDQKFGQTPIGCGPFKIVPEGADLSSGFDMVAFDEWYAGRPNVDKITVQIIPELSSRVSALEAGDVDMLDIAPLTGVKQLKANSDITVVEVPGTNWAGLTMNFKRPPWDNVDARMAVAKAIDRKDLIEKAFFGLAMPSIGAIAPAFAWAYPDPAKVENPQAFDKDQAKALADKAGLNDAKPTIMITTDDSRPAQTLKNQLKDIGVDLQIEQLQQNAWNERWLASDFDWIINGSVVDADPDDGNWNFFYSKGPWNTQGYNNPKVDKLLEEERRTADQEQRAKMFQDMQALEEQDVAYAFLYHTPDEVAFYNYVKGYLPIPEMRYLEHVWLDK